jgi:ribonuclease HI
MKIEAYTDGSATTANKPGGWAYVLVIDDVKYSEGSGHVENATNNDMELEAAIQGLGSALKWLNDFGGRLTTLEELANVSVTLCSDSQLVLGWASGRYRFKQEGKTDKYKQLRYVMDRLGAKTQWVKGHNGNIHNERCDKLANNARKNIKDVDKPRTLEDTKIGTKKDGVVCLWHGSVLKIVDLSNNIVENYNRDIHGKRGSMIEIREDKTR